MNYGKVLRIMAPTGPSGWRLATMVRFGLTLALLLVGGSALAGESILTLGVLHDGKLEAKASRAVHERLSRAGELAPPTSHLTLAERQCALPECLDSLAAREKVQLIMSARVQQSSGFSYIAAFLYDVANQRSMDVSAVCDKCLPEALALKVGDLFERLLHDYRDRQSAEATSSRRPGKTTATARADATAASQAQQNTGDVDGEPTERATPVAPRTSAPVGTLGDQRSAGHGFNLSPRRKLIAGILGGVGVATLAASIALHLTDGNTTSMDCDLGGAMAKVCVLDHKAAYSVGYAVTSALAVGVGMTLFWPESAKSNRTEVKQ